MGYLADGAKLPSNPGTPAWYPVPSFLTFRLIGLGRSLLASHSTVLHPDFIRCYHHLLVVVAVVVSPCECDGDATKRVISSAYRELERETVETGRRKVSVFGGVYMSKPHWSWMHSGK